MPPAISQITPVRPGFARRVIRWFDNHSKSYGEESAQAWESTDWLRVIPYAALHLACFAVFLVGFSWIALAVAVALYFGRMFAITGFYHRYFSHRTFRTSRPVQLFLAMAGNSAVQRGPLWWAAHHRKHHQYSDGEQDVHSPVQHGFIHSHIGWIFKPKNARTNLATVPDLAKFPELVLLDRFDTLVPALLAAGTFALGSLLNHFWPALGTNGPQMLVWGFVVSTVVLAHGTFTINSLSHLFGNRRFETEDDSRNNWFLALITMGEGWHNNHHRYPTATRQGFRWYELDLTYYLLFLLSKLGIIWSLKPVPAHLLEDSPGRRIAA